MKSHRQAAILEIIEREAVTSQEQLRERLRTRGVEATQATISRDVRDLGLIKRPADGAYRPGGPAVAPEIDAAAGLRTAGDDYPPRDEGGGEVIGLRTKGGQGPPPAAGGGPGGVAGSG